MVEEDAEGAVAIPHARVGAVEVMAVAVAEGAANPKEEGDSFRIRNGSRYPLRNRSASEQPGIHRRLEEREIMLPFHQSM
jgi:hypothetical protein